jgi:hypothetical protein
MKPGISRFTIHYSLVPTLELRIPSEPTSKKIIPSGEMTSGPLQEGTFLTKPAQVLFVRQLNEAGDNDVMQRRLEGGRVENGRRVSEKPRGGNPRFSGKG